MRRATSEDLHWAAPQEPLLLAPPTSPSQYDDGGACGAPVALRIMSVYASQWALSSNTWQFWR